MDVRPLFLIEEREKTFKNWPFSDKKKCNVRNMAEAGFYSVATGTDDVDAAKCFLCGKELDGWEADDDPWAEHKSHAGKCAFVQLGKNENDLLVCLNFYTSTIQLWWCKHSALKIKMLRYFLYFLFNRFCNLPLLIFNTIKTK